MICVCTCPDLYNFSGENTNYRVLPLIHIFNYNLTFSILQFQISGISQCCIFHFKITVLKKWGGKCFFKMTIVAQCTKHWNCIWNFPPTGLQICTSKEDVLNLTIVTNSREKVKSYMSDISWHWAQWLPNVNI